MVLTHGSYALISIHVLREEDDLLAHLHHGRVVNISIHVLREEDDRFGFMARFIRSNFYPRPPRGGRRCCGRIGIAPFVISIHVLREEDDMRKSLISRNCKIFLSTSSARRTTASTTWRPVSNIGYFYPRPPRGGRRTVTAAARHITVISIHVLREEDDADQFRGHDRKRDFYPRPPRGGRLVLWQRGVVIQQISIHVLREEDDS